jgi:serralysin
LSLNALTNKDTITDFNVANDNIHLDNAIFAQVFAALGAATSTGGLHASLFGLFGNADSNDRIIYNSATGELIYDINGSAGGGATVFALLTTGLGLTNADFIII